MSAIAFRLCVVLLLCTLGYARNSSADPVVIYSNFGPSPGFFVGSGVSDPRGYLIGGELGVYGMGFQLAENARLSSIEFPLIWGTRVPTGLSVVIFGSPRFSDKIEAILVSLPEGGQPNELRLFSIPSALQPTLFANTQYFLGVITAARRQIWPWNNSGASGPVVDFSGGPVVHSQLAAFRLTGEVDPVPEPATMLLFATGAGLALQRGRRRKHAGPVAADGGPE